MSAPISSSFGRVSSLRGTTLDFAITKDVLLPLQRKATAPYAVRLASAKTCSLSCCLGVPTVGKYCLGICTCLASWIFFAMVSHCCWSSSDNSSSQSMVRCCHNDCMNVLALMVTGDSNPRRSKTLEDSLKTSLSVTSEVTLGIGDLDIRESLSIYVTHCSPRTLTGLLESTTLSLDASSVSWWLLEAQLLRLK